jgi:hypothetical protein
VSNLSLSQKLIILLIAWVLLSGGGSLSGGVTAVTYVYEKDDIGSVPSHILVALDELNHRTPKIVATPFEDDAVDDGGQVPEQYKIPLTESKAKGSPKSGLLVVLAKERVVRSVTGQDLKTKQDVLDAAK